MRALQLLFLAGLFLLLPAPARAWGPAAHLEFGLTVLKDLALMAPAVAILLKKFPDDFLYGSIAADITVGKDLSPYYLHCHNWQVGFTVLDLAEKDATRSFAWGYLAHLAADIVAHNYYIPYKLVQNFERRRARHVYWELRYDTHMNREAWNLARQLAGRSFREHDRHLRKILSGPLFSFRVNKQLFNSMVLFNQIFTWKRMTEAHKRRTTLMLTDEEVREMYRLSVDRILDLLGAGVGAGCLDADPTGHRNILIARDVRRRLRRLHEDGRLLEPDAIGPRFRKLFRDAIDSSKLTLPSLLELTDPEAAPPPPKTARRRGRTKKKAKKTTRRAKKPRAQRVKKTVRRLLRRKKKDK